MGSESEFCSFGEFEPSKNAKFHRKSKFRACKCLKMATFETVDWPILISRIIWMTEKFCNFHIVSLIKYLFSPSFFLRKGGENTFVKTFLSVDLTEKYEVLIFSTIYCWEKRNEIDLSLRNIFNKVFSHSVEITGFFCHSDFTWKQG